MGVNTGKFIWHDGQHIKWEDANIHIMSHVIHYGSSVFEGIRTYDTNQGPAVFRLRDHIQRLYESAKIYRMDVSWTVDEIVEACVETVRKNNLGACYIRPVVFRGYGSFGVNPFNNPLETYIAVWEWGAYLGADALESGVDVCFSSWNRFAPNTLPAMAKCSANYMNSQLIKMEAIKNGYSEGIALDTNGYVSEGSGENIFVIKNGVVMTPPLTASILPGITRNTVISILTDLGYEVKEMQLPREMLYIADEVFFSGTAAEVTPIRSIDKINIGNGKRGEITARAQAEYFNIFNGKRKVPEGWLTPIK
ncbi:MAG: branched-chain amino acid transaminase [Calditrichales bacterium]|nr:MAG: branched-chain amino acid transaminase [Calditrichales bacterium]